MALKHILGDVPVNEPRCRVCGVDLTDENWYQSRRKDHRYICKVCHSERVRVWRKANTDKMRAASTRADRKHGVLPFAENRECSSFLGVHVAERVLSRVFKDVKRMPMNNPGYDIICSKDKWIDVKSSCQRKYNDGWMFHIDHNTTADYFLCLAFDNREDLNPLHVWLLPGDKFNHLVTTSICPATVHKWDEYKLGIEKMSTCCNTMKGDK